MSPEAETRRRRSALELALAGLLALLWLGCLGLHLELALRGTLTWVPLYVAPAAGPDAHPEVTGFWPETPLRADGVERGDRLIAVGDRSLAGASRVDTLAAIYSAAARAGARGSVAADSSDGDGATHSVSLRIERAGAERSASLALRPLNAAWSTSLLAAAMGLAALLVWRRRGDAPAARAAALAMLAYALHWSMFLSAGGWRTPLGLGIHIAAGALFGPFALRAVLLFSTPEKRAPRWPWAFAAMGALWSSWLIGTPLPGPLGLSLLLASYVALIAALLLTIGWSYHTGDAIARRQLRWVVLSFYLGLAPPAVVAALAAWDPLYRPLYEWSLLSTLFIPVGLAIALTRYQLFDIDRIISATAAYSTVLIGSLVLLATPVLASAEALGERVGIDTTVVNAALVLLLASLVTLVGPRLQPRIERLFFRERHAFQTGVRDLRRALGAAPEPGDLFETLGSHVADLLRLRNCAVYVLAGEAFTPAWARGPGIPPGFAKIGRLAALLEDATEPVDETRWRRWAEHELLDRTEAGELESVDAKLLVPILSGKRLAAILCLGEKASGDIYTPVDVALLEGLADRISAELFRFDTTAIERHQRRRLERLAHYVPAPVRDEMLARTIEAHPGEREVSVLFVDVRGYTGFSESRTPDEIFRVVNAYTTAASRVIREHAGWVVEFQGDGLMAVFGAPSKVENKERAAIDAAIDLVDTFRARAVPELAEHDLEVGVGVATGPAYVGNVQSIDRKIWCVIGNTTNLAARLQSRTKELGFDIVIDDATHAGAGRRDEFQQHARARVRGRTGSMTIHLARPAVTAGGGLSGRASAASEALQSRRPRESGAAGPPGPPTAPPR